MNIRLATKFQPLLVTLGWAASTAALTIGMIFLGYLLPKDINGGGQYNEVINANPLPLWIFYIANFAICILASFILSDISTTLVSFFGSYVGAATITYVVLALPDIAGCCRGTLEEASIGFVLVAFFPQLLVTELTGTLLGVALGEHYS
ncbi:MAG TPA: hypothetical protein VEL52_07785 [Candidatus Bathyarchaeia archaeon]|nr:hypothetical protein [Candidatus Bathyarchaeia archaeon]